MRIANEDIRGEAFGNGSFEQRKRTKEELRRPAARHARRVSGRGTPVTLQARLVKQKGRRADALAPRADERRDKLR